MLAVVFVQRFVQEVFSILKIKRLKENKIPVNFAYACAQTAHPKAIITKLKDANPNARYRHEKVSLKDIIEANQQV